MRPQSETPKGRGELGGGNAVSHPSNVNGQKVNLEVQVADEGDYPERSLYYWAREYSSALPAGNTTYSSLPRVIIISIVDFPLFDCA
jgi:predicted transposase/invertase (TIGR01784 family)